MGNWRFGAFPKLPYSTMQQLNLDWILDRIRRFLPDNGTKGQVLTRTKDGAAWVDPEAASGAVSSVNGKTGAVVLTASDVGALPSSYQAPVTSVNGMTGDVVISGGGAVDSVNGKTGDVVLTAADVGALPSSYVPPAAPVQSVNGKTGAVVLDADDVGALPNDYTPPVTSVNGQTGAVTVSVPVQSVNGKTGAVVIETPADIFNKELSSRCWGKAISSSVIDFILYLPYIEEEYNIAFTNNRVNVADIGTSTVSTIHARDKMCVYFRVSVSGATTNRMYVAGATFTLTKA